ncbi:hypothetical protein CWO07_26755 [Vibrio splendidus]|uniref:YfbU family protein n=1 Tax=Vibrio splendidus TaxID=29497 RepID=A0A2T5DXA5_VIBSP|nr:YfbU family protein [Vibrio splendidus]PTP11728.1 hypothetical protein CWO07_26755 [Vibrio splendidus]
MNLTKEQKLMTLLLCDIHKSLGIKDSLDASLIQDAIIGGHDWALEWELDGQLIPVESISKDVVSFVTDVLDMYSILEGSFARLSKEEKEKIKQEASPFGDSISFPGFDGNNECEHMSVCNFLITKMDRFSEFDDRARLNSHYPTVQTSQRMLSVFLPLRTFPLSAEQIVMVLKAKAHS